MAIYITIRKVADSPDSAEYTYGTSEDRVGRLRLNKSTGDVSIIQPALGDDQSRLYLRAAHKIKKHWSRGETPEITCWAS
jgi:hypothetical protein